VKDVAISAFHLSIHRCEVRHFCLRFTADCNGNIKTATVTLQFVQAIVAKPDQFFYYTSPVTFAASAGLLLNDVVPGSCASTTPTFAVVTPPTSGSVVVRTNGSHTRFILSGLTWICYVLVADAKLAVILFCGGWVSTVCASCPAARMQSCLTVRCCSMHAVLTTSFVG
jgi:hypothetical protein